MENEELQNEVEQDDLVDMVKDLKDNSVSKEEYNKLQSDYKKLMKTYIEGKELDEDKAVKKKTVEECRAFLNQENLTNLDFIKGALELREVLLEETGEDVFVGRGHKLNPTHEDYEAAERVAEGLQEIVDRADGDAEVFLSEYQRLVKDSPLPKKPTKKNNK